MNESSHIYIAGLVLRVQQDDTDAFSELYALTYNKIYNYCRHYLRDDFLAQDALQEVYISALRNIRKINDPSLFVAWLNRIAFHICYDITRNRTETDPSYSQEILEFLYDEHPDSNPEYRYERNDEAKRVREAVEALPFQQREVITLRYFNNMKINEIADALTISTSSVKRYLSTGQEQLRKIFKD